MEGGSSGSVLTNLGMNTALEEDTMTVLTDSRDRSELLPAEHRANSIANFQVNCCSVKESLEPIQELEYLIN